MGTKPFPLMWHTENRHLSSEERVKKAIAEGYTTEERMACITKKLKETEAEFADFMQRRLHKPVSDSRPGRPCPAQGPSVRELHG